MQFGCLWGVDPLVVDFEQFRHVQDKQFVQPFWCAFGGEVGDFGCIIHPLDKAAAPPSMQFMNGSGHDIDTLFPDNFRFFELLAMLVEEEPLESFGPLERFQMQAIGIEKGRPFAPDEKTKALLGSEGAIVRKRTVRNENTDGIPTI